MAARFIFYDFARLSDITTMLEHLGWNSLEKRQDQLTEIIFYKITNNFVHIHNLAESPNFIISTTSKHCVKEQLR